MATTAGTWTSLDQVPRTLSGSLMWSTPLIMKQFNSKPQVSPPIHSKADGNQSQGGCGENEPFQPIGQSTNYTATLENTMEVPQKVK